MIGIIVVIYSLAILISIILFLIYRNWIKKQNDCVFLSIKSGVENFKIVNRC